VRACVCACSSGKRVVVVKTQGNKAVEATDDDGSTTAAAATAGPAPTVSLEARVATLRAGAAAAVARLRALPGVSQVAVDLGSVAACLPGDAAEADVVTGRGAVVQSTLLANYAFDKYATTAATKKRLRTLSHVVRALWCRWGHSCARVCPCM
jgi:hypothetical protein